MHLVVTSLFELLGIWFQASQGSVQGAKEWLSKWDNSFCSKRGRRKHWRSSNQRSFKICSFYRLQSVASHGNTRCVCSWQRCFQSCVSFLELQWSFSDDIWTIPFQLFPLRFKMLSPWAPWALVSYGQIIPPALGGSTAVMLSVMNTVGWRDNVNPGLVTPQFIMGCSPNIGLYRALWLY
jgi:hypothetical protein